MSRRLVARASDTTEECEGGVANIEPLLRSQLKPDRPSERPPSRSPASKRRRWKGSKGRTLQMGPPPEAKTDAPPEEKAATEEKTAPPEEKVAPPQEKQAAEEKATAAEEKAAVAKAEV